MKHGQIGERTELVLDLIQQKGEVSLKEIRVSTDLNHNTIRGMVISLTNMGLIERVGWGRYRIKR